jgi:hypothetical protein
MKCLGPEGVSPHAWSRRYLVILQRSIDKIPQRTIQEMCWQAMPARRVTMLNPNHFFMYNVQVNPSFRTARLWGRVAWCGQSFFWSIGLTWPLIMIPQRPNIFYLQTIWPSNCPQARGWIKRFCFASVGHGGYKLSTSITFINKLHHHTSTKLTHQRCQRKVHRATKVCPWQGSKSYPPLLSEEEQLMLCMLSWKRPLMH